MSKLICTTFLLTIFFVFTPTTFAAPYPQSKVITGISFDSSTLVKSAPGSDQFGYTTGSDGNIYVSWGDGGGFGGTNSVGRASLGVGRITGTPPSWKGVNLWGGANPLSSQASILGKTSSAIIAVNGTIYAYVIPKVMVEEGVWTNNTLWKSTDLGLTWKKVGQLFNEPSRAFAHPGIIQFGPNYQGARDKYVYGYDENAFTNGLALFRVDKSKLESRSNYEFFTGLDASGNPKWSTNIQNIKPVFEDTNGTLWGVSATYHPTLKRYLLSVRHGTDPGGSGSWGLFEGPEPWGPWSTVAYGNDFPNWTYSKDPNGASSGRPAYIHNFPQKWMGADGRTMWQISDRGDQFNLVKATLTLASSNPPPPSTTPTPCNNVYSVSSSVPNGYGASYNVFSTSKLLVSASCSGTTLNVTAGDNDPNTYVYNQGYIYKNNTWTPYELKCSGSTLVSGAWCPKKAVATITNAPQDATNYFLAYTCEWRTDAWKCGCKDTTCKTNMWQLQAYSR